MRKKHAASSSRNANTKFSARNKRRSSTWTEPNSGVTSGVRVSKILRGRKVSSVLSDGRKTTGRTLPLKTNILQQKLKPGNQLNRNTKPYRHFHRNKRTGQSSSHYKPSELDNNIHIAQNKVESLKPDSENCLKVDELPVVNSVCVYQTVTEALSAIKPNSPKTALVLLNDITKKFERDCYSEYLNLDEKTKDQKLCDTYVDMSEVKNKYKESESKEHKKMSNKSSAKAERMSTNREPSLTEIRGLFDKDKSSKSPTSPQTAVSPKVQRGRKSRLASPDDKVKDTEKRKSSKALEDKQPDIVVTPPKKGTPKNSPMSSRGRKSISPKTPTDERVLRKRAASLSPKEKTKSISPGRKKQSAEDCTKPLHLDIPDSEIGNQVKRTRSPSAKFKEDMILYPWDTSRKSPKKSPALKTPELREQDITVKTKQKVKSSPKTASSQGSPSKPVSPKKKQSIVKEDKPSKKEKHVKEEAEDAIEPVAGTSSDSSLEKVTKTLSFGADVTPVEGINSLITKDYKYKYQSASTSSNPIGLTDLISKVSSSIESTDEALTSLFGQVEEVEDSEESEPPIDSSLNSTDDSGDSDKTIIHNSTDQDIVDKEEKTADPEVSKEKDTEIENDVKDENLLKGSNDVKICDISDTAAKETTDKVPDSRDDEMDTAEIQNQSEIKKPSDLENDKNYVNCEGNSGIGSKDTENKFSENEDLVNKDTEQPCEKSEKDDIDSDTQSDKEKTSIFDMFGLKLKRKPVKDNQLDSDNKCDPSVTTISSENSTPEKCKSGSDKKPSDSGVSVTNGSKQESDDDVMIVSESHPNTNDIIVLSDEENKMETEKSPVKKPKFLSVDKSVEPKPLEILSNLEQEVKDKKSVFLSEELDTYLYINKENIGPSSGDGKSRKENSESLKKMLENPHPDFDDVDDMIFLSFPCEQALQAHVGLEKKVDWLHDSSLKKMTQLKSMKERQQDSGSKRLADIKHADEQKQSFRGIPMRMMKYNKMLTQELQAILKEQNENAKPEAHKTPEKTTDITKIKGWKNKYRSTEELLEATSQQLSESGKLHWKTEEKLLKNLDPDEVREIGLDLKKKRRKLINFSKKKNNGKLDGGDDSRIGSEEELDDFELEEGAITEKDVYNEDDNKPMPDKVPYKEKYLSQHKYGQRKMFVKKMGLDSIDEKILKKLGTSKVFFKDGSEEGKEQPKQKQTKSWFTVSKLTMSMAVAAASALSKPLINKQRTLMKKDKGGKKGGNKTNSRASSPRTTEIEKAEIVDEVEEGEQDEESDEDYEEEEEEEDDEEGMEIDEDIIDPDFKGHPSKAKNQSKGAHKGEPADEQHDGRTKDKKKNSSKEICDQPGARLRVRHTRACSNSKGCRYGCICHLCKLSDSSEEKETDRKPPCDKEYCKLGCICESIDNRKDNEPHCRKPSCMFECKCPPKQPKPDIPKSRDGKKRKKRWGKKKGDKKMKSPEEKQEEDDPNDWEPPSKKKKRGTYNLRFANLPKRESTYRVAKNLDAVSRKAMEVYATSEMYTEQRMRRRKSDQVYDMGDGDWEQYPDLPRSSQGEHSKASKPGSSQPADALYKNSVFEVSDESDGESFPTDLESCGRLIPYTGNRQRRVRRSVDESSSSANTSAPVVIDLVESEEEEPCGRRTRSERRSRTLAGPAITDNTPKTLTERMGLIGKPGQDNEKWKTQMVCLKAKKKTEERTADGGQQSEIKLLEIISNCNWEVDRKNMLSKISHIITRDSGAGFANEIVMWQRYILHFLPRADKPAVIPPELKSTLPNSMYSIRVRVTKYAGDEQNKDSEGKAVGDKPRTVLPGPPLGLEGERRECSMKLQKKLIDKIKFAEKLRDLIIAEEKKGSDPSKFSVSLEGIEKALKKYKTQLWKAYTGNNNMTLNQLKRAVEIAKAKAGQSETPPPSTAPSGAVLAGGVADTVSNKKPMSMGELKRYVIADQNEKGEPGDASAGDQPSDSTDIYQDKMNATLERISMNQGLKIVHSMTVKNSRRFIPLGSLTDEMSETASNYKAGIPLVASESSYLSHASRPSTPTTVIANSSVHGESVSLPVNSRTDTQAPLPGMMNSNTLKSEPQSVERTSTPPIKVKETLPITSSSDAKPSQLSSQAYVSASNTSSTTGSISSVANNTSAVPVNTPSAVSSSQNSTNSTRSDIKPLVQSKPGQSDVLLIPVQENGTNKWNPNSHPVLSAKMTLLPNGNAAPLQNGSPVVNTVLAPQAGPGIIPVIPMSGSPSVRPPGPDQQKPAITGLGGKALVLQSDQPGNMPIMINSIQPVSSPVYSSVQKLSRPAKYNPAQAPLKSGVVVSSCSGITGVVRPMMGVTGAPMMFPVAATSFLPAAGVNSSPVPSSLCSVYPVKRAPITFSTVPISQTGKTTMQSVPVKCIKGANNIVTIVPLRQGMESRPLVYSTVQQGFPQTRYPLTPVTIVTTPQSASNCSNTSDKTKCAQNNNKTHQPMLNGAVSETPNESNLNSVSQTAHVEVDKVVNPLKPLLSECNGNTITKIKQENKTECDSMIKQDQYLSDNVNVSQNPSAELEKTKAAIDTAVVKSEEIEHTDTVKEEPEGDLVIDELEPGEIRAPTLVKQCDSSLEERLGSKKRKMPSDDEREDESVQAKVACTEGVGSKHESVNIDGIAKGSNAVLVSVKGIEDSGTLTDLDELEPQENKKEVQEEEEEDIDVEEVHEKERESMKLFREQCRRRTLRKLFDKLSALFKDHPVFKGFKGNAPISLVLSTALSHIQDLQQKEQILAECLEDGQQHQKALQAELQQHIDFMARSGRPEKVIRNFLKSVACAIEPSPSSSSTSQSVANSLGTSDAAANSLPYTQTAAYALLNSQSVANSLGTSPAAAISSATSNTAAHSSSTSRTELGTSDKNLKGSAISTSDVLNVNAQNVNSINVGHAAKALEKIVGEKVYTLSDLSPAELQKVSSSGEFNKLLGTNTHIVPKVHPSTSKEYTLRASRCENESLVAMDTQRLVAMDTQGDDDDDVVVDSDEDEIRSTTGYDSMLDHDIELMLSDEDPTDDT